MVFVLSDQCVCPETEYDPRYQAFTLAEAILNFRDLTIPDVSVHTTSGERSQQAPGPGVRDQNIFISHISKGSQQCQKGLSSFFCKIYFIKKII